MRYLVFAISLLLNAEGLAGIPESKDSTNLLANPSFEELSGTLPVGWETDVWDNEPGVTDFAVRDEEAHHGRYSVTIINHQPNDARLKQTVKVDPDTTYRVSCWVMTRNVASRGKGANVSFHGIPATSRAISGTTDGWQPLELYLKTGAGVKQVELTLGLGGYGAINQGEATFDQVRFEKVTSVPEGVQPIILTSEGEGKFRQSPSPASPPGRFLWILVATSFGIMITAAGYYRWALAGARP